MDSDKLVGVLFGAFPQPYHRPFIDRLSARYSVDVRYAHGQWGEHIQALANELVERGADVLVTFDTPGTMAATRATTTIPTVSQVCGVFQGQPVMSQNVTGLARKELDAPRQLRLLLDLLEANGRPSTDICLLWNGHNPAMERHIVDVRAEAAAHLPRVHLRELALHEPDNNVGELLDAVADLHGLVVLEEPVIVYRREEIVAAARRRRVPAMYESTQLLDVGGLAAYGPDRLAAFARMADYVDLIIEHDLHTGNLPPAEDPESKLLISTSVAEELRLTVPDVLDGLSWEPFAEGVLAGR